MPAKFTMRVVTPSGDPVQVALFGPLELGRQRENEPAPFGVVPASGNDPARLMIAAEALVQIVGLRSGRVLLLDGENWKTVACNPPDNGSDWRPSTHVLAHVYQQKRIFWQTPQQPGELDTPSMPAQTRVVA